MHCIYLRLARPAITALHFRRWVSTFSSAHHTCRSVCLNAKASAQSNPSSTYSKFVAANGLAQLHGALNVVFADGKILTPCVARASYRSAALVAPRFHMEKDSLFPHDVTLEEARRVVAESESQNFRECAKDDYVIFNYDFAFLGVFPDPQKAKTADERRSCQLRRECRGLIFHAETGKLLSRRLHKFFNVNEMPETDIDYIDWDRPFFILDKVDGSLVAPFRTMGEVRFGTKGGVTEVSRQMEEHFLRSSVVPYLSYSTSWLDRGCTPIYEWCSPRQTIVIGYEEDSLTLLAIRNNKTGHYVPHAEMVASAGAAGIPVVATVHMETVGGRQPSGRELLELTKAAKNIEGCVIRFENDEMYKIKSDWYMTRSKKLAACKLNAEKDLWRVILENELDDVASAYDPRRRRMVQDFQAILLLELAKVAEEITSSMRLVQDNMERGEFARRMGVWRKKVSAGEPLAEDEDAQLERFRIRWTIPDAVYFAVWKGDKDARTVLVEHLKRNCKNTTKFEQSRTVLGDIRYDGDL